MSYPEIVPPKTNDEEEVRRWREDVSDRLSYHEVDIETPLATPPTNDPTIADSTIPVPTSVGSVGGFASVVITFDEPSFTGAWATDVFWSLTNDYLTSVKVGDTTTGEFVHYNADPDPNVSNYYFVRYVNDEGVPGPFASSVSASVGDSPSYILEVVKEQIGFDEMLPGSWPIRTEDPLPLLPDVDYPIGCVVLLLSDGKLYRNKANVWTSEVDSDDLVANSVIAGKIAAGALVVDDGVMQNGYIKNALIADATIEAAKINTINADSITTGTLLGRTIKTSTTGERVEMHNTASGKSHQINGYNSSGTETFTISASSGQADFVTVVTDDIYPSGSTVTINGAFSTTGNISGGGSISGSSLSVGSGSVNCGPVNCTRVDAGDISLTGDLDCDDVFATDELKGARVTVTGLAQCGSLRINQTPSTGSGTATVDTTKKPGGNSSNTWLSVNLNGSTYYIPVWS